MRLGTVVRPVWPDKQLPAYEGKRLMLVHTEDAGDLVAVDLVSAGPGVGVLVVTDEAAQSAAGTPFVDAAIVALVSSVSTVSVPPTPEGQ